MRVAGLLLAAGKARRFGGGDKLLAPLDGRPLLAHAADAMRECPLARRFAVVGPGMTARTALLHELGFTIVDARHPDAGIGASIATGIAALPADVAGALVLPADMPRIGAPNLQRLCDAFAERHGRAIVHAATADGAVRSPAIFPRRLFADLAALSGDAGARRLIAADAAAHPVPMTNDALADVDTLADLARLARTPAAGG